MSERNCSRKWRELLSHIAWNLVIRLELVDAQLLYGILEVRDVEVPACLAFVIINLIIFVSFKL